MSAITISRDGQQFGPYTMEEIQGYLASGNLVPTDLAWDQPSSSWVPLASLSGVQVAAPPPPAPRPRNVFMLILMGLVWWLVMVIVPFFIICFLAGMIAGALHPDTAREAGRAVGRVIGVIIGLPLIFIAGGLSVWLTIAGKLPGTSKYR